MPYIVQILGILVVVWIIITAAAYFFQGKLVYFPTHTIEAYPSDVGLVYDSIDFSTSDGIRLHGWYVPVEDEDAADVVLFCHGNGGNISHRLDTLRIVNDLGLSIFLFDYRGYGKSAGKPTEEGTALDAAAAWDFLTSEKGFSPDRIICWGRSLGGAVAARQAAAEKPKACILESTFTSVPDMGAKAYPFLPVRMLARFRYNTVRHVQNIQCPILIIHSPQDDIVPYEFGKKVFAVAPEPKQFLQISGDHNTGYIVSEADYKAGLTKYFNDLQTRSVTKK